VTGPRGLLAALVLVVLGAAALLVSLGQTWVVLGGTAVGEQVEGARFVSRVLALAGLAAAGALLAVRGAWRVLVGVLLVLLGAGIVALAYDGLRDPLEVVPASALRERTAWPWLGVAGAGAFGLAGALAVVAGRRWPALGSRYDRTGDARPSGPPRPASMWEDLDRGQDPTTR
jgi:uncharacterized membrane protein (TIGR02234 family)